MDYWSPEEFLAKLSIHHRIILEYGVILQPPTHPWILLEVKGNWLNTRHRTSERL